MGLHQKKKSETTHHSIGKIELDLTGAGIIIFHSKCKNKVLHFYNPHYPDRKSFNKAWLNSTLGKKIYKMFSDSGFEIPEKVKSFNVYVSRKLIVESTIDEDILNFVKRSPCDMNKWKVKNDAVEIKLSNVNPMELIGAIAASIKKNEHALGPDAEFFDIKSMEKIPAIKKFEDIYTASESVSEYDLSYVPSFCYLSSD